MGLADGSFTRRWPRPRSSVEAPVVVLGKPPGPADRGSPGSWKRQLVGVEHPKVQFIHCDPTVD